MEREEVDERRRLWGKERKSGRRKGRWEEKESPTADLGEADVKVRERK